MSTLRWDHLEPLSGGPFLLATDYDGTLAPIVRSPELARISEATLKAVEKLSTTPGVTVAVLSGRALTDLRQHVPFPAILAGNHGLEIAGGGIEYIHPDAAAKQPLLAAASEAITARIATWPEAWVEKKGLTATVHFRNLPARYRQDLVFAVRRALAPFQNQLGLRAGKCSLELHPRVEWHKGRAALFILKHLGLLTSACFCLGDDNTDEHMFRCLPEAITVRVGQPARTAARFLLSDSRAVGETLNWLANRLGTSPATRTAEAMRSETASHL